MTSSMRMTAGETGEAALASVMLVVPTGTAWATITLLGNEDNEVRVFGLNLEHINQLIRQAEMARDTLAKKSKRAKVTG